MSRAVVTITATIPSGYADGDYALLYGNGGSGDIDFNGLPLDSTRLPLFHWGVALTSLSVTRTETACGVYRYAFLLFDALGNRQVAAPEEDELTIHFAPDIPDGLRPVTYDSETDVLSLEVA
jgi:hypothetical protein